MALSAFRWGFVTRSTSEKRNRYTSSWRRAQEKAGSAGQEEGRDREWGLRGGAHVHRDRCRTAARESWTGCQSPRPLPSTHRQGKGRTRGHTNNRSSARTTSSSPTQTDVTQTRTHTHRHTRFLPFPAFLTLIRPPVPSPFSSIHLSPLLPMAPSPSLLAPPSLARVPPAAAAWYARERPPAWGTSGPGWRMDAGSEGHREERVRGMGRPRAHLPAKVVFVLSPVLFLSLFPLLGGTGSVSVSPFHTFELPWDPHHWEGNYGHTLL